MKLFEYSVLTAFILIVIGLLFAVGRDGVKKAILGFPRSQKFAVGLLVVALAWFIGRHVMSLTSADFGEYKPYIGLIAVFIAVSSYIFVNDFLAVRSFCILILFYSRETLDAAWLQEPTSRLLLVSIIYLLITSALYFGAWPYRMRDFLNWIFEKQNRAASFGWVFVGVGFALFGVAFSY